MDDIKRNDIYIKRKKKPSLSKPNFEEKCANYFWKKDIHQVPRIHGATRYRNNIKHTSEILRVSEDKQFQLLKVNQAHGTR